MKHATDAISAVSHTTFLLFLSTSFLSWALSSCKADFACLSLPSQLESDHLSESSFLLNGAKTGPSLHGKAF